MYSDKHKKLSLALLLALGIVLVCGGEYGAGMAVCAIVVALGVANTYLGSWGNEFPADEPDDDNSAKG